MISDSQSARSENIAWYPAACSAGANGWSDANAGQVIGIISAVAFSFIVHDPSGIMLTFSARSCDSSSVHVAQHLGFGVMRVEDRVREIRASVRAIGPV